MWLPRQQLILKQKRFKIIFFEMTVIFDKEQQKNIMSEHSIIHKTGREKNDS